MSMALTVENKLNSIKDDLIQNLDSKSSALPKDFQKERFVQNALAVLKSIENIAKVEQQSVITTILRGAFLGLDFASKECYAICYTGVATFQTDYKGEIKLAKLYSVNPVKEIFANLVRKGDDFSEEIRDGRQTINFRPLPFNDGEILGAFAVCNFKDGSMSYATMSKRDIEEVKKNYSKSSPAWIKSQGEMYKKTVLRRLCKMITLDFDSYEQRSAWEESADADLNKKIVHVATSSLDRDDSIIDAESVSVEENQSPTAQEEPLKGHEMTEKLLRSCQTIDELKTTWEMIPVEQKKVLEPVKEEIKASLSVGEF